MSTNSYAELNESWQEDWWQKSRNLALRVHRAMSWLRRAEKEDDPDSRFIFLWIAFNAAYATEIDERHGLSEQATFNQFLEKLHQLDTGKRLDQLVWDVYSGAIRTLLDNKYVYAGFWDYYKGLRSKDEWQKGFAAAKKTANKALGNQNTTRVLAIALSRIYVLRNQLLHGGATWNGRVNREQIRDCVSLMNELVPAVIAIMMEHPNTLWGEPSFPLVDS